MYLAENMCFGVRQILVIMAWVMLQKPHMRPHRADPFGISEFQ